MVPCYNEESRLRVDGFRRITELSPLSLLFVDDGSTDRTAERLEEIVSRLGGRGELLRLPVNGGKGEAVRQGMLRAIGEGAATVGYADADLSTPPEEIARLARVMEESDARVVMGSRVRLLGRRIERRPARHYAGRVFATVASLVLGLPVYDTQCGAKFFRVTQVLADALSRPFSSRWSFDVELIGRLLHPRQGRGYEPAGFVEVPLRVWHDVAGSKLTAHGALRAGIDLLRIGLSIRRGGG